MVKSTIEGIEGMDTINIENIPSDTLKELVKNLNNTIEKAQKDKQTILSVLTRRGEKE